MVSLVGGRAQSIKNPQTLGKMRDSAGFRGRGSGCEDVIVQ